MGSRKLGSPARKRRGKASRRGISRERVCIRIVGDRSRQTIDTLTGRGALTAQQTDATSFPGSILSRF